MTLTNKYIYFNIAIVASLLRITDDSFKKPRYIILFSLTTRIRLLKM